MLKLHIVQADHGDGLILHYGTPASPRYTLIDGGPRTVYQKHLRDQLLRIRRAGGKLDRAIVSHVDNDHIIGLLDLMDELQAQRNSGTPETIAIDGLWHNSFSQTLGADVEARFRRLMEDAGTLRQVMSLSDEADRGIRQGDQLTRVAAALDVRINPEFSPPPLICVEDAPAPIVLGNLSLHVVGPTRANLDRLRQAWLDWLEQHERDVLARDPLLAERAARVADQSIPNLSSVMLFAEAEGKTILLTGDGRGDHLLEGLAQANLLDPQGHLHVDVLKVPHHGSARNVTQAFFRTITADTYVICANGKHDNPDLDTLQWIVAAAREQGRAIEIVVTNATESTRQLVEEFEPDEHGYRLIEMKPDDHAMTLELVT